MKVCALALASYPNQWLDALNERCRALAIPIFCLVDSDVKGAASGDLSQILRIFSLTEIPDLRQALADFDCVLVVSEGYLPSLELRSIPVVQALNAYPDALGLSLRSLSEISYLNSAQASAAFKIGDSAWTVIYWQQLDINDYPRFDCCCCLYLTKQFVELTIANLSELAGIAEVEARGARSLRNRKSFIYISQKEAICERLSSRIERLQPTFQTVSEGAPEISVIIPTRNRPKLLERALMSVLSQSFRKLEAIIVNDGGPRPADSLLNCDARVRYIEHQVPRGPGGRNSGVECARGKFVAYLDDDDVFWPRHLEMLHSALVSSGAKFVFGKSVRSWEEGDELLKRDSLYSSAYSLPELLQGNLIPILCILHEKELFNTAGVFDEELMRVEDWDLWLRFALQTEFQALDVYSSEYRFPIEGGSFTSSGFAPFWWHEFVVRAKHRKLYKASPDSEKRLLEVTERDAGRLVTELVEQSFRDPRHLTSHLKVRDVEVFQKQFSVIRSTYPECERWWAALEKLLSFEPYARQMTEAYHKKARTVPIVSDFSIVIPIFNRGELARQTIESLYAHTESDRFELILVDNGSTEDLSGLLADCNARSNVKIIRNQTNRNFAAACNQGVAAATHELILFLHSDLTLTPGWLEPMIDVLRDPSVGVVGNKQLCASSRLLHHCGIIFSINAEPKYLSKGLDPAEPQANSKRDCQAVSAASMLVRKGLFQLVSGFDETFINGMEDCDFCLKVVQRGLRVVYTPYSQILRNVSTGSSQNTQTRFNLELFARRWQGHLLNEAHVAAGKVKI